MRVLLIEDEPTTAKAIELMLTNEGFNVYTTDLGEEGLDLGKLYDYDIICLDLNLPDMHGYDVLKKLRTAKVATPVLILSGVSEMDSRCGRWASARTITSPSRSTATSWWRASTRSCAVQGPQPVGDQDRQAVGEPRRQDGRGGRSRVHLTGKEYAMLELLSLRKARR
jgi:two-component system cell cycle response regulator CtrA